MNNSIPGKSRVPTITLTLITKELGEALASRINIQKSRGYVAEANQENPHSVGSGLQTRPEPAETNGRPLGAGGGFRSAERWAESGEKGRGGAGRGRC